MMYLAFAYRLNSILMYHDDSTVLLGRKSWSDVIRQARQDDAAITPLPLTFRPRA